MEKTKLGLNVGMMAALVYMVCNFAGYTVALMLVGYVLLCEDNAWLKKCALKGTLIMIALSVCNSVINLIPNIISIPLDLLNIFGFNLYFNFMYEITNLFYNLLSLVETVVLLMLSFKAVSKLDLPVPVIDKLVEMFYED